MATGTYKLDYQWTYTGLKQLKATVNGWVKNINYDYNYGGGMTGIGSDIRPGGASTSTSNVISGLLYRGFGGLRQMDYGNGLRFTADYSHQRQQLSTMKVFQAANPSSKVLDLSYN